MYNNDREREHPQHNYMRERRANVEEEEAAALSPHHHHHHQYQHHRKCLPKRIILVRHGESQGNLDGTAYTVTPDHKIPLTQQGIEQSKHAGGRIRQVISDEGRSGKWRVYFYVSPYERTRSTLREIGRAFNRKRVIGAREEVRVREQDFGNFQVAERMKAIKETRERYGRFFYRFPEGESAADVFDRVSSFLESLWRDIDMNRLHHDPSDDLNLIIVSHGLASRVFLMKWFKWTVEQFEYLNNLGNAEFRVMQLGLGGEYSLAIHHTEEEMLEWGLSPDMIADQKWRANACRSSWSEKCTWYIDSFFDNLAEDSADESNNSVEGAEDSNHSIEDANHCAEDSNHSVEDANHCDKDTNYSIEDANHCAEESNHSVEDSEDIAEEDPDKNEEDVNHCDKDTNYSIEDANHCAEESDHSVEDSEDIAEEDPDKNEEDANHCDKDTNYSIEDANHCAEESNHSVEDSEDIAEEDPDKNEEDSNQGAEDSNKSAEDSDHGKEDSNDNVEESEDIAVEDDPECETNECE